MEHEFVLLIDGQLRTFTEYEDIPEVFEHVVKFKPYIPEPPHTEEQHAAMVLWNDRLQALMKKEKEREYARRHQNW